MRERLCKAGPWWKTLQSDSSLNFYSHSYCHPILQDQDLHFTFPHALSQPPVTSGTGPVAQLTNSMEADSMTLHVSIRILPPHGLLNNLFLKSQISPLTACGGILFLNNSTFDSFCYLGIYFKKLLWIWMSVSIKDLPIFFLIAGN